MTGQLNRQLHAVLNQAGVMEQKEALIASFTDNRTVKSSEMYDYEARQLINSLNKQITQEKAKALFAGGDAEKNDRLRKLIISNWYKVENAETKEQKSQAVKNCLSWVLKSFKKPLNDFSGVELYKIKLASDKVLTDKAKAIRKGVAKDGN